MSIKNAPANVYFGLKDTLVGAGMGMSSKCIPPYTPGGCYTQAQASQTMLSGQAQLEDGSVTIVGLLAGGESLGALMTRGAFAKGLVAEGSTPSAQSIIQSTARSEAGRGVDALKASLTAPERAAMAEHPELTSRMLGQAVHRNTAAALDEAYPGRFLYSTRGPDFVDTATGEMLELTTPGQVGAHLARPGYANVTICTYGIPTC